VAIGDPQRPPPSICTAHQSKGGPPPLAGLHHSRGVGALRWPETTQSARRWLRAAALVILVSICARAGAPRSATYRAHHHQVLQPQAGDTGVGVGIRHVRIFTAFLGRSPDTATAEDPEPHPAVLCPSVRRGSEKMAPGWSPGPRGSQQGRAVRRRWYDSYSQCRIPHPSKDRARFTFSPVALWAHRTCAR
jgi:hypothetical protein